MIKPLPYFRLFSSCIAVQGNQNSLLFDLERKESYDIPELLCGVLAQLEERTIPETKAHFEHQYDEGIDAYLQEFEKLELGFFTDEPEAFPKLEMIWEDALAIQTAIIEIDDSDAYDVLSVLDQLDHLACAALQLRILKAIPLQVLQSFLAATQASRLRSIELFLPDGAYSESELIALKEVHQRIALLVVHSSPQQKVVDLPEGEDKIFFVQKELTAAAKDYVSPDNFVLDVKLFSEAHHYNVALNRKVSIDHKGFIKNYPSHEKTYGQVSTNKIAEMVQSTAFQEKWLIPNDQIIKCQDCPHRYTCSFNSDLKVEENKWTKIDDCGFDPYTNQWK